MESLTIKGLRTAVIETLRRHGKQGQYCAITVVLNNDGSLNYRAYTHEFSGVEAPSAESLIQAFEDIYTGKPNDIHLEEEQHTHHTDTKIVRTGNTVKRVPITESTDQPGSTKEDVIYSSPSPIDDTHSQDREFEMPF